MRRFMCGAKEDSGGCFFFFFLKGRIVNYLGTDGSQSAIEFDYRLNGIHNEKALIWRETYEKAISITPHAKLGYQPRPADSQAFGWLSISYFLSSSLPSLMTARVNHVERSCLFACFWNLPQLHSWKRDAFVIVNWSPLFMKYNFVFRSIIDTLVQIITGLAAQLRRKSFDRLGVQSCLRRQRRADYYRSFKMFCPGTFKSWQPVKYDCCNEQLALTQNLIDRHIFSSFFLRFKSSYWLMFHNLFDLLSELGCVQTYTVIS